MKRTLFFYLITSLGTGCYKQKTVEAKFDFPDVQSKIVVNCILTPSDSVFASVHKLLRVYDTSVNYPNYNDGINNATVILENTTTKEKITLFYLSKNGLYGNSQTRLKITSGNTYTLTVSAPKFQTVISTCKVPEKAAIFDGFKYSEPYNDGLIGNRRRIEGRWQDVSATDSYYYGINLVSQIKNGNQISSYSLTSFSDNITKTSKTYFYQSDITDNEFPKIYTLLTAEENLYKYYVSAEKIKGIASSGSRDFFGAFQGIIPEYSNIKNGHGVFGAFLGTKTTVIFK